MRFISETYEPLIVNEDQDLSNHFFVYDLSERDFFLTSKNFWYKTKPCQWYTLAIGNYTVSLPSHLFIMVGDIYSDSVDWIKVEELGNREMTTFLYSSKLHADEWTVEEVSVLYIEEIAKPAVLPYIKHILPIAVGKNRMILVSENELYNKTKGMNFQCLY